MKMATSLRKLSKRDKRAVAVLAAVGGVVLVIFAVVLPFYDARADLKERLTDSTELLQRYVQVLREETVFQQELSELEQFFGGYQSRLLEAPDTSTATIQLEEVVRALASENGISITRSNPLQERQMGENYLKITLQINMQSNMSQLSNFLYGLSAHPKFFLVENFFLNSFRTKEKVRLQPRMNVSGFIRLS